MSITAHMSLDGHVVVNYGSVSGGSWGIRMLTLDEADVFITQLQQARDGAKAFEKRKRAERGEARGR